MPFHQGIIRRALVGLAAMAGVVGCSSFSVQQMPSQSYNHRVQFLVMHFTAIDYQKSVNALVNGKHVSSHYLIPERFDPSYPGGDDLQVYQLVDEQDRAWHAGVSHWQGRENLNDQSIGIEIVNVPRCERPMGHHFMDPEHSSEHGDGRLCIFPDYDPKQIELLVTLSKQILARHPDISPTRVVGHSDIIPSRKNDPGPRFPWYQLYKEGIGAWYDNDTVNKYWQQFSHTPPSLSLMQAALRTYGYGVLETGEMDSQTLDTLSAFQMHFLPWHVNGEASDKTAAVLFALLDKYFPRKLERLMSRYAKEQVAQPAEVTLIARGQIDEVFPQPEPSSRVFINDRRVFKAYAGQGEIIIDSQEAQSADIYINGQKLNIQQPFSANQQYRYSLSKRTHSGTNTLKVANVKPEGASIRVTIPYPQLQQSNKGSYNFNAVDSLIENDIANGFPGAVLMVVKDGKVVKQTAYGYQKRYDEDGQLLANPQPMHANTLFDMASNTKMYATNYALMKLASQGKLDISRPIADYIPEYRGGGRSVRTVKDLLEHTAGYGSEVRFFDRNNALGERFFSQNKARTSQLLISQVPFETGRHVRTLYSDTDYMLLGLLVERIAGMPLDTYVETQIYQPLGLTHSVFNPLQKGFSKGQAAATELQGNSRDGRLDFDNIRTYTLQGEVHDEKAFYAMGGVSGHAGMFSTASDMAVLTQILLNRGGYQQHQVFSANVLDQFAKASDADITQGLGWRRAGNGNRAWHFGPYASPQAIGHTGWTGTVTVVDPAYDLAIILLTNRKHSPIVESQASYGFAGDEFETGRYGSVISLVYEAILGKQ